MTCRDTYTWANFTSDLSMKTHLTHMEAHQIAYCFEHRVKDIHPYDVFPTIERMAWFLMTPIGEAGAERFAQLILEFKRGTPVTSEEIARVDRQFDRLHASSLGLSTYDDFKSVNTQPKE